MFFYLTRMSDGWGAELGDAWDNNVLCTAGKITRGECGWAVNKLKWSQGWQIFWINDYYQTR